MYIPESFRVRDQAAVLAFMRQHDFATLVTADLEVSHVPVLVRETEAGLVIAGHLARANPHWRVMDGRAPAVAVFHGPHGYISPNWYPTGPAVPTWNYAVVHARGAPRVRGDEDFVRGVLDELTARYEGQRPDGWSAGSVPVDWHGQLLKAIVAFELPVASCEAKFKLGQNRSPEDRAAAASAVQREGAPALAALMRAPPK